MYFNLHQSNHLRREIMPILIEQAYTKQKQKQHMHNLL